MKFDNLYVYSAPICSVPKERIDYEVLFRNYVTNHTQPRTNSPTHAINHLFNHPLSHLLCTHSRTCDGVENKFNLKKIYII